jgi:AcrR family transcriptional regulator
MVAVVCAQGFAGASVSSVCARAGVSRPTFYELFDSREECFLAVIDDGYRRVSALIAQAFAGAEDWREGLRMALADLLKLFDSEPDLARVWLVDTLAAGPWALERRAQHIRALTGEIVRHWRPPPGAGSHPLAAVSVMESLLGIIQAHALTGTGEPMIALLGPLMGVVVAPYLEDHEVENEVMLASRHARMLQTVRGRSHSRRRVLMPAALLDPRAHRARTCLRYLAGHPGASNREVADAIGIKSHPQISALLSRLLRAGLVEKRSGEPGHPNAWTLTQLTHRLLDTHPSNTSQTLADFTITS